MQNCEIRERPYQSESPKRMNDNKLSEFFLDIREVTANI
jgi:hypothetical protein